MSSSTILRGDVPGHPRHAGGFERDRRRRLEADHDDRSQASLHRRDAQGFVEENNIKPSKRASDEEFLRRAYLDVLGRTPNISEAMAFLRPAEKVKGKEKDKEVDKRVKEVEYLLSDPDYSKNFATQWKVNLLGRKMPAAERRRQCLDVVAPSPVPRKSSLE